MPIQGRDSVRDGRKELSLDLRNELSKSLTTNEQMIQQHTTLRHERFNCNHSKLMNDCGLQV